jgi:hypothetical protein
MNLKLTDAEAALLLKELNGIIDGNRYFLFDHIKTPRAVPLARTAAGAQ